MIDLEQQTVIICGGPQKLASGIARQMNGATVIMENYKQRTQSAITSHFNEYKHVDTVVILPHWYKNDWFMETTNEDWDAALEANYEHAVYIAQAAAHHMIANEVAGSIIFVSTIAIQMPLMQTSAYATSLAMLHPLAKMIAVDCAEYGIRANTVAAGWVESEWAAPYLEANRSYVESGIPAGKVAEPGAIGDVCCFLASPLSRYITGSLIPVDGGYSLTRSDGDSPYP